MTPYSSSSEKENCLPQSSNCVIWQGPNLSCINLCKGDSISDVVYKLASELCTIKASTDLTDLDFSCILDLCVATPEPALTIAAVFQTIIDGVCCSVTDLTSVTNGLTDRTNDLYEEPILVLPLCLQYTDPSTGLLVTTLKLSDYAVLTAQSFCSLQTTVTNQSNLIYNIDNRVTVLEDAPPYTPPVVTPHCTYGSVTSGVPAQMNIVLDSLDEQYCQLRDVLGTNTELNIAASSQCTLLGSTNALSQSGTMSSLPGWNNTISNLAQSLENMWITICDMRGIMYDLKECCGAADCSAFFLGYTANADAPRENVTLIFNSFTVIPSGFTNCPLLSTVSITDGDGNIYTDTLDLVALATNPAGITYDVSTAFLNPLLPYTVTVTGCIVKDSSTCSKVVTNTISVPPPTTTTTTTIPCACYSWDVLPDAADIADATGNTDPSRDGKIFVSFAGCTGIGYIYSYSLAVEVVLPECTCGIPNAHYYKVDVSYPCIGGTLIFNGLCPAV